MTNQGKTNTKSSAGRVPIGTTIGLGLGVFCLSGAGFGVRWMVGESVADFFWQALAVMGFFVLGLPCLFCVGALVMNHFLQAGILLRNAWTLGWLMAFAFVLSLMGIYS